MSAEIPIVVIEGSLFIGFSQEIWSEEERKMFIDWLARNPEAGAVMRGLGGVRKVRWSGSGRGKRGGARIIYYFYDANHPILLITAYAKAEQDDVSQEERKSIRMLVERIKKAWSG